MMCSFWPLSIADSREYTRVNITVVVQLSAVLLSNSLFASTDEWDSMYPDEIPVNLYLVPQQGHVFTKVSNYCYVYRYQQTARFIQDGVDCSVEKPHEALSRGGIAKTYTTCARARTIQVSCLLVVLASDGSRVSSSWMKCIACVN
jgi:hypothetical protein